MGNMRSDRTTSRWPNGVVPFAISPHIGDQGRLLISTACQTWQGLAPVRFVERTDEPAFVSFQRKDDKCFSTEVGRAGGMQSIGCEFPLTPVAPPGARLSAESQVGDQRDCLFAGTSGAIHVMFTVGSLTWSDAVAISQPGVAVPGAPVTLAHQGDGQLDAVFVGVDGKINVMWAQGGGAWQGPVGITEPGIATPGAPIALDHQGDGQLDAVFVGVDGKVNVMWAQGGGAWQGPVGLTEPGVASAGAPVTLAHQGDGQLDAVFVGVDGKINVMWAQGRGAWQGPVPLATVAGPDTSLCAISHSGDVVEVMVVGGDSEFYSLSVKGLDAWSGLSRVGGGFGQPAVLHEVGHALGLFHEQQRPDRDNFITYNKANVQAGEEHNFDIDPLARSIGVYDYGSIMHYGGGAFAAPGMGPTLEAPAGIAFGKAKVPSAEDAQVVRYIYGQVTTASAVVAAAAQTSDQLTLSFADTFGAVSLMWVVGDGTWEVAVPVTAPGVAAPGTAVTMHHQGDGQLDAVFVGVDGKVNVMWAQGGGAWQGPVGITEPGIATPGAPIALDHQGDGQLDAVFVGVDGKVNVMWAQGGGAWQGPVGLTEPGVASAGAPVTLAHQGDGQLDAVFVGVDGKINVMWAQGGGAWQGPVGIS